MKRTLFLAAAIALLGGCAVPKIMLYETFLPGSAKVVKESLKPVATAGSKNNKVVLSNYYIQICDVAGSDATNCKTTLVLENVTNYNVTRGGVFQ